MQVSCPTYPLLSTCDGHGICDTVSGLCICDDGWSSVGDFSSQWSGICQIHIQTIKIMWIIAILFVPVLLIVAIYNLKRMLKTMTKQRFKRNPFLIHIIVIIGCMGCIPLCALKIIDPTKNSIGLSFPVTFAFHVFYSSIFSAVCLFLVVIIKFLINQTKIMSGSSKVGTEKQKKIAIKMCNYLAMAAPFCCAFPYWSIVYPRRDYDSLRGLVGIFAIVTVILAVLIVQSLRVIVDDMDSHLKQRELLNGASSVAGTDNSLKKLRNSLGRFRVCIYLSFPFLAVAYISFISWKLLSIYISYAWPCSVTICNIILLLIIQTFTKKVQSPTKLETKDIANLNTVDMPALNKSGGKEQRQVESNSCGSSEKSRKDYVAGDYSQVVPTN